MPIIIVYPGLHPRLKHTSEIDEGKVDLPVVIRHGATILPLLPTPFDLSASVKSKRAKLIPRSDILSVQMAEHDEVLEQVLLCAQTPGKSTHSRNASAF